MSDSEAQNETPFVRIRVYHDGRVTLDNGRTLSPSALAQLADAIRASADTEVALSRFLGNIGV